MSVLRFSRERRLSALLLDELTDPIKAAAGAHVVELGSGRTVFEHRHDEPLLMASTTKLFTAGTALNHLGADTALATGLGATARPDADGTLDGDLVIRGDGDPLLGDSTFLSARYDGVGTPVERVVAAVADAGIRAVRGRVIGDGSLYAHEDRPAPSVTALSFNQSTVDQPVLFAAEQVSRALEAAGISVGADPAEGTAGDRALHPVGHIDSLPIRELLRLCGWESDNTIAAALAKRSAVAAGAAQGSSRRGTRLIEQHAATFGAEVTLRTASGLGTGNRSAPRDITAYLAAMEASPLFPVFEQTLPRAGTDGTLRYRMRNTRAAEVVRAKTGTLTERREVAGRRVRRPLQDSLAGYCRGRKRSVAFSLVHERAEDLTGSRVSIDRVVEAIVDYCDRR